MHTYPFDLPTCHPGTQYKDVGSPNARWEVKKRLNFFWRDPRRIQHRTIPKHVAHHCGGMKSAWVVMQAPDKKDKTSIIKYCCRRQSKCTKYTHTHTSSHFHITSQVPILIFAGTSHEKRLEWNVALDDANLGHTPQVCGQFCNISLRFRENVLTYLTRLSQFCVPSVSNANFRALQLIPIRVYDGLSTQADTSLIGRRTPSSELSCNVRTESCGAESKLGRLPEKWLWCKVRATKFTAAICGMGPSKWLLFNDKRRSISDCRKQSGTKPSKLLSFKCKPRTRAVPLWHKENASSSRFPLNLLWLKSNVSIAQSLDIFPLNAFKPRSNFQKFLANRPGLKYFSKPFELHTEEVRQMSHITCAKTSWNTCLQSNFQILKWIQSKVCALFFQSKCNYIIYRLSLYTIIKILYIYIYFLFYIRR